MSGFIVGIINFLIRGLGSVLTYVFGMLPDSPFQTYFYGNTYLSQFLGFINYFIPIQFFGTILSGWLIGISVYYVYQVVLRWVKSIE